MPFEVRPFGTFRFPKTAAPHFLQVSAGFCAIAEQQGPVVESVRRSPECSRLFVDGSMPIHSLAQVDDAFLEMLVRDRVLEDRTLEYKRDLPTDHREFAADVVAFANSLGGLILYGIEEGRDEHNRRFPQAVCGAAGDREKDMLRLEQMIRDKITPRILGVKIKSIGEYPRGSVIAVEIPRSWIGPHMVNVHAPPFFGRGGSGRYPLSYDEIRAAYFLTASAPERVRQFRDDRISQISLDETPLWLGSRGRVILHLVPTSAFDVLGSKHIISLPFDRSLIRTMCSQVQLQRYNLDGLVASCADSIDGVRCAAYTQLFHSGCVEFVESFSLALGRTASRVVLDVIALEEQVVRSVQDALTLFQQLETPPPIAVLLTLLGAKGALVKHKTETSAEFDRDVARLPEVILDDLMCDVRSLRPLFDGLWQAAGVAGSPSYAPDGRWAS